MLSKNTRPGTKVVGIANPGIDVTVTAAYRREALRIMHVPDHRDCVFTVGRILACASASTGYAVELVEVDGWWPLQCYRPLELPRCLQELLAVRELENA